MTAITKLRATAHIVFITGIACFVTYTAMAAVQLNGTFSMGDVHIGLRSRHFDVRIVVANSTPYFGSVLGFIGNPNRPRIERSFSQLGIYYVVIAYREERFWTAAFNLCYPLALPALLIAFCVRRQARRFKPTTPS